MGGGLAPIEFICYGEVLDLNTLTSDDSISIQVNYLSTVRQMDIFSLEYSEEWIIGNENISPEDIYLYLKKGKYLIILEAYINGTLYRTEGDFGDILDVINPNHIVIDLDDYHCMSGN